MKRISLVALAGALMLPASSWAQPKNVAKPIAVIGIVAGAPRGQQFNMRANGQTYRVTVLPYVPLTNVKGGDRVRVWGIPTRANLQRANVRVLASGVSDNPDDYNPAGN
ncbi:hypothetical protein EON83_15555 [bacterium]|nr:MAG: hypothetical protein EON83_15555 [bacterium]